MPRVKKLLITMIVMLALPVFILGASAAKAQTFEKGDVFAGVAGGNIQWWRPSTHTLITTLNSTLGGYTTGMAFDGAGNLYGTNFSVGSITKYDTFGAIIPPNPFVSGMSSPESIAFSSGFASFYVGQAGTSAINQFDTATGALLKSYTGLVIGPRGTDWIDLAADNHTIYYTSEGTTIHRYDTATSTQLTDFATGLPGSNAFALRILPDGSVLVADTSTVVKLNPDGSLNTTFTPPGSISSLFSLNLDPDGGSFWTGDSGTGLFYQMLISDGTLLDTFDTGFAGNLFGLAVFGERTAPIIPVPPSVLLFGSGLGLVGLASLKRRLWG